jgi:hypothetical protein
MDEGSLRSVALLEYMLKNGWVRISCSYECGLALDNKSEKR